MFTIFVFFIILSVLVLVHELGHFLTAKKFGIKVEEFGFGLPPRIWGLKIGETIYSVNWLPFGGFVKLFGEDNTGSGKRKAESAKHEKRAFFARPPWQRAIVLLAGVTMNFLLAIVVLSYLFTQGVGVLTKRVHIENVTNNSPAGIAGIKKGDIVETIEGITVSNTEQFRNITNKHLGEMITLTVIRGATFIQYGSNPAPCVSCSKLTMSLTPRKNPPYLPLPKPKRPSYTSMLVNTIRNIFQIPVPKVPAQMREGPIGVSISSYETRIYPWYQAPYFGIKEAFVGTGALISGLGVTLGKLFTHQSVSADVAGPLGIAQMTGQAVSMGLSSVLELVGILSLNLAIINVLPFPALDGGRLLFVVVEWVTRKKVNPRWESYLHQVGMIVLLLLIALVTYNDIARYITTKIF